MPNYRLVTYPPEELAEIAYQEYLAKWFKAEYGDILELKAIYGGLVMLEYKSAKFIDSGEQSFAATQEENALEKSEIELNMRWVIEHYDSLMASLAAWNGTMPVKINKGASNLEMPVEINKGASNLEMPVEINKGASNLEMPEPSHGSAEKVSWIDHVLGFATAKATQGASDSKRESKNAVVRYTLGGIFQEASRPKRSPIRKYLPMILHRKTIGAQHDTGAEGSNFMTNKLAEDLKLHVRTKESDRKSFSMGTGKVRRAIGRVKAWCSFAKESGTRMKCWFYVLPKLASPLIMGSQFLRDTKTMSHFTHRLEDQPSCTPIAPMVNLISSTQQARRRLVAFIDDRQTYINADSGSHLDLVSSAYTKKYGYNVDRRRECRKRIRLADATTAETIGQVKVELMLHDGSTYLETFDVLPGLTSEVLIGEDTLDKLKIFTEHEGSFIDVLGGERHFELSILSYLGRVNEFLVRKLNRSNRRSQYQYQRELSLSLSLVFRY